MSKNTNFENLLKKRFDDIDELLVSDDDNNEVTPISTGLLSLDASIGIGGFPRRRFTMIDGPESSGKTTIALGGAKMAILEGGKVLFIDVENESTVEFINELTVPNAVEDGKVVFAQPISAEEAFMIAEAGIISEDFDLIILDSVGALSSDREQSNEFKDDTVAGVPRLINKFLRRMKGLVRKNNVAFVFINQVRDPVGKLFAKAYVTPGGHGLKHLCAVIISLTKGLPIKAGKETVGINTKFTVKKNKMGPPFRSYIVPIIFGKGVDSYLDLVNFTKTLGILTKAGPYFKFNDVNLGRGVTETIAFLENNKEVLDKIRESVYNNIETYGKEIEVDEGEEDAEELEI